MKKFLSLFTVLALLAGMFSTLVVSAAVNTTEFYNAQTNEQITILDGVASLYATTTFTGRYEDNASVIVAHYNADGKLIAVESIVPVESTIGESVTYTTPEISVADTGILKVFAWTGVDSIKPLLKFPGIISRVNEIVPPTATVSELNVNDITDVALTFAMNFKADPATEAQLLAYGTWYADYVLTVNKDVTFNLDGTKDGYLAGQYDSWSPAWVAVPKKDVTVAAGTPVKIMETAAETYGEPGLKYTYAEVYDRVKDFDCGVFFTDEFLAANPDLKVTLELRMYNPLNEAEYYSIAGPYTFPKRYVTQNAQVLTSGNVTAEVPAGVMLEEGVTELTLTTTALESSESGVEAGENETLSAMDIHVEGVSSDNTTPIIVTITEATETGYNKGNLSLYHVEDGEAVSMEEVETKEDLVAHNQFTYDPADGTIAVAMATFSEVAVVAERGKEWNGAFDYTWYDVEDTELTIANADQLAGLGAIVGGMADGIAQDDFAGKTVKLISDLNFEGGHAFYPIGYYNNLKSYTKQADVSVTSNVSSFEGIFDGNGNTIKNIYQNTWEMFGDYNDGYEGTPNHYKDAMGVFGYVKGTVKNLTVRNFTSDGEFTPTGCVAAYAGGNAVFENITLENCNPRVYNTGNGGIVGINGRSDEVCNLTFRNITIDQTNKISALWGSWDVGCGGIMGMLRGMEENLVTFENCHVAAVIDVNNDVCANYQYYQYRYAGMFLGTVNYHIDENGRTYPDVNKHIVAKDCTATYGDWNEYWYCELVANSLASYTHDHQFSRLTKIASESEISDGTNWTKAGNFVIPNANEAEAVCYHIMKDENGNLYRHLHEDSGTEVIDGKTILKEDRQHYYIPFGQLFTGYGWGVTAIYEPDATKYPNIDIEIKDGGTVTSQEKFESTGVTSVTPDVSINVTDLFTAKDGVNISSQTTQVFVSPADETSTASAIYSGNSLDWTQGAVTFTGKGLAKVTITDYFYCTATTIIVDVDVLAPSILEGIDLTAGVIEYDDIYVMPEGYLWFLNGNTATGYATIKLGVPEDGEYQLMARVTGSYNEQKYPTFGDIDFTIDGTTKVVVPTGTAANAVEEWDVATPTVTLTKGNHEIKIMSKDAAQYIYIYGVKLEKYVAPEPTPSPEPTPEPTPEATPTPAPTPTPDVSNYWEDAPYAGVYQVTSTKDVTLTNETCHTVALTAGETGFFYLIKGNNNLTLSDETAELTFIELAGNGMDYIEELDEGSEPCMDLVTSSDSDEDFIKDSQVLGVGESVTFEVNAEEAGLYYMATYTLTEMKSLKVSSDTGFYDVYDITRSDGYTSYYKNYNEGYDMVLLYLRAGTNYITYTNEGNVAGTIEKASISNTTSPYNAESTHRPQLFISKLHVTPYDGGVTPEPTPTPTPDVETVDYTNAPYAGVYQVTSDKAVTLTNETEHTVTLAAGETKYFYLIKGNNNLTVSDTTATLTFTALEDNGWEFIGNVDEGTEPHLITDTNYTVDVGSGIYLSAGQSTSFTVSGVKAGLYYMSTVTPTTMNNLKVSSDTGFYDVYNATNEGLMSYYKTGTDMVLLYLREGTNTITYTNEGSVAGYITQVHISKTDDTQVVYADQHFISGLHVTPYVAE